MTGIRISHWKKIIWTLLSHLKELNPVWQIKENTEKEYNIQFINFS